jgi:hypothetical protein
MNRWRRRQRGLALGGVFLAMAVLPGQSCGPFFTDAIFVLRQPESRVLLMKGKPGIVWADFGFGDLALAYRAMQGPAFTDAEIASETPAVVTGSSDQALSEKGMADWLAARKAFTGADGAPILADATVPGEQWQTYGNCLEDAFTTAAKTLQNRERDYASAKSAITEWVHGQDAVFSNCAASGQLPADSQASMPGWLRNDRAYQLAAAHFYRADWQRAQTDFQAIAADSASVWHDLAAYMYARTLIRQATLSKQNAFDEPVMRAAQAQLREIARGTGSYASAAQAMLNYVDLRLEPGAAAARLGDAIAQRDPHLSQDVTDLRFALNNPGFQKEVALATRSDLVDWILTIKGDAAVGDPAAHALERWRATKSPAWLASALMLAGKPDSDLVKAATSLQQDSPTWATATYHRLRSTQEQPEFEAEVAALLPTMETTSTRNAFQELAQNKATSLNDFLSLAAMVPAAYDDGAGDLTATYNANAYSTKEMPTMAGLPVNAPDAKRFNAASAFVLNEQLPLESLVDVVQRKPFPRQLQFELAMAVWTRAVLLNKPEEARLLTPAMVEGEPGWKQWLAGYDNAKTDDDRRMTALLALMRFPSARPYVNAGAIREDGFVGYSAYRDNWWCAGMGRGSNLTDGYSGAYNYQGGPQQASGATPAQLSAPSFLSAAMIAEAKEESSALNKIGDAPEYFGEQSLAWVKTHPKDPRGAELLGFAFRAMRNGCNLEKSTGLRRDVFNTLHAKYPNSPPAKQYATFVSEPD